MDNSIIDIENLTEWREHNPGAEWVRVKHGEYGITDLFFNYKEPKDVTIIDTLGQYDASGNFHFIDSDGHKHICLSKRPYYKCLSNTYKWHNL